MFIQISNYTCYVMQFAYSCSPFRRATHYIHLRTTVIIHTSEAKPRQLAFLTAGYRAGWYCSTGYSLHDFLNVESETSHSSIYNDGSHTQALREKQIIIFAITISDSFANRFHRIFLRVIYSILSHFFILSYFCIIIPSLSLVGRIFHRGERHYTGKAYNFMLA